MSQTAYRILSGITCIVSITSAIGSGYLLRSWFTKKKKNEQELLDEYIAYMSFPEFLSAILYFIFWTNPTMDWHWISQISHGMCVVLGAFNQFLQILTTTFNFALSAFIFLPIICGTSMNIIEQRKPIHLSFVFGIAFICTLIPFYNNHYGFADDDQDKYGLASYQCWINQDDANYYLCLYLPAAIYVTFAFCLMIYARLMVSNEYYQILIDQLTWYTIAFVWVWFAGITNRIYNAFISDTSPFWLLCARIVCESSMGTVRAIIWWNYLKKDGRHSADNLVEGSVIQAQPEHIINAGDSIQDCNKESIRSNLLSTSINMQ